MHRYIEGQTFCKLPSTRYFVRLSDAIFDGYLLKEEIQENDIFTSYALIYLQTRNASKCVNRDQMSIFILQENTKIIDTLIRMRQNCYFLLPLPLANSRLTWRLIDVQFYEQTAGCKSCIRRGENCYINYKRNVANYRSIAKIKQYLYINRNFK